MNKENVLVFKTWKTKISAAVVAVIAAVALPQLVHLIGGVSGLGTSLGEAVLPMHIAVLAVGFLAGPWVGFAVGAAAPAMSFALTGMPTAAVLPFMTIELAAYGLVSGLFAEKKLPFTVKLLIAQVAGRAIRSVAVLIAFYGFGGGLPIATIWTSIITGLPGIILQWIILPLMMYRITNGAKRGRNTYER